jgi:hypothetical protein
VNPQELDVLNFLQLLLLLQGKVMYNVGVTAEEAEQAFLELDNVLQAERDGGWPKVFSFDFPLPFLLGISFLKTKVVGSANIRD